MFMLLERGRATYLVAEAAYIKLDRLDTYPLSQSINTYSHSEHSNTEKHKQDVSNMVTKIHVLKKVITALVVSNFNRASSHCWQNDLENTLCDTVHYQEKSLLFKTYL